MGPNRRHAGMQSILFALTVLYVGERWHTPLQKKRDSNGEKKYSKEASTVIKHDESAPNKWFYGKRDN